jgi:hypothetical protein
MLSCLGRCWAGVVNYYFAFLPDGFYTPSGAHESDNRAVIRNTCCGWTYGARAAVPPQLQPALQEPLWRELLLEVHSIDKLAGMLPWLDLIGRFLIIVILVSVVLWNPVIRELQVRGDARVAVASMEKPAGGGTERLVGGQSWADCCWSKQGRLHCEWAV